MLLHFVLFDLCSPVSAANFGGNGIVDVLPPHSACHAALLPVYFFLLAFLLSVMSCLWPPLPILLPNLPCCLQALLSACLPYSPCTCLPLSVVLSPLLHVCPSALLPSRFVARLVACLSPACWFLVACPPCYLPLYAQPVCLKKQEIFILCDSRGGHAAVTTHSTHTPTAGRGSMMFFSSVSLNGPSTQGRKLKTHNENNCPKICGLLSIGGRSHYFIYTF